MEADNLAVSQVRSSSKSHMQSLSCNEGGRLSHGAEMFGDTFQQNSTLVYLVQVPAVNTSCLAWLQQHMQMVGVMWHFTKDGFCLVVTHHLLRAVQLAPNTADSAEWVATKWDAAEHLPVIQSFLSSLKVRTLLLQLSSCKLGYYLLDNHAGCSGLCLAGQAC